MTNTFNQNCPLCNQSPNSVNLGNHGVDKEVSCPRCGDFIITESALFQLNESTRYKMSAWAREKYESGKAAPRISCDNVDTIISSFPIYNVADKQRLLLKILDENTLYPGETITLDISTLWPRLWAANEDEMMFYVGALKKRGFIDFDQGGGTEDTFLSNFHFEITPKGWDFLEDIKREKIESSQVFVAMSFDQKMYEVWLKGIKPAIEATGFKPYRVDNDHSNLGRIDAKIETEIKRSKFLVADVTGGKQGVYYEAGFAKGQGIEVIWCVHEENMDDMHFDTKQYKHIIWKNPEDLARELKTLIIAAIGENVGTSLPK